MVKQTVCRLIQGIHWIKEKKLEEEPRLWDQEADEEWGVERFGGMVCLRGWGRGDRALGLSELVVWMPF